MTIISINTRSNDRRPPVPLPNDAKPVSLEPYPAPDFPFKGYKPPQPDGYKDSAANAADCAIVLDNGKRLHSAWVPI